MTAPDQTESDADVLGVLGGLGPAATVAFMDDVIAQTPASRDQDHIEMIVYNDPKIPDRNYPSRRDGAGPLPRLLRDAERLAEAGAELLVIASNTTHRYYDDIDRATDVPMLHMISVTRQYIESLNVSRIGVLTTDTAVELQLFDNEFVDSNVDLVYPDEDVAMEAIYAYKRGDRKEAQQLTDALVDELQESGVEAILLGCTEFSALSGDYDIDIVDSSELLASRCVETVLSGRSSITEK